MAAVLLTMRERTDVCGKNTCALRDVPVVFVKLGLISGGFRPSLRSYDGASAVLIARRTEECVLREHRVFSGQGFGAQMNLLNSFLLIQEENERKEEV